MKTARVLIHSSQFPENVRRDLLASLRDRCVNHKFHYQSVRQAQKWLALHEAHSPARTDADCQATYDRAFAALAQQISAPNIRVIGLGCGGGQKDARLLELLRAQNKRLSYAPSDVSVPLVITAQQAAQAAVNNLACDPLVFDLATAEDLPELFDSLRDKRGARLLTFFGMIPNFEPDLILPRLSSLVRPSDHLLFSANLIPQDTPTAMRKILPGYDNDLTRDWLSLFLYDMGLPPESGELRCTLERTADGHRRVAFYFDLTKHCSMTVEGERFEFEADENIQLFFSCRYTTVQVNQLLSNHNLKPVSQWIAASGEEGVFLCRK